VYFGSCTWKLPAVLFEKLKSRRKKWGKKSFPKKGKKFSRF
jgi:hypothetical protein